MSETIDRQREVKHTAGPWGVCEGVERGSVVIASAHVDDAVVASVGQDLPECEANAHLIAAAPDLLDACRALDALDCCEGYNLPQADYPKLWDALGKARAAINKVLNS